MATIPAISGLSIAGIDFFFLEHHITETMLRCMMYGLLKRWVLLFMRSRGTLKPVIVMRIWSVFMKTKKRRMGLGGRGHVSFNFYARLTERENLCRISLVDQ